MSFLSMKILVSITFILQVTEIYIIQVTSSHDVDEFELYGRLKCSCIKDLLAGKGVIKPSLLDIALFSEEVKYSSTSRTGHRLFY